MYYYILRTIFSLEGDIIRREWISQNPIPYADAKDKLIAIHGQVKSDHPKNETTDISGDIFEVLFSADKADGVWKSYQIKQAE